MHDFKDLNFENVYIFKFISKALFSIAVFKDIELLKEEVLKIYDYDNVYNINTSTYKFLNNLNIIEKMLIDNYLRQLREKLNEM